MTYIITLHYSHSSPLISGTVGPFKNEKQAHQWVYRNCPDEIWQCGPMVTAKKAQKWIKDHPHEITTGRRR